MKTTTPLHNTILPTFFPIPQTGSDPYFGLGRSSYYDLERRGLIHLVRILKPGNRRGKVLVPYAETLAALRKMSDDHDSK